MAVSPASLFWGNKMLNPMLTLNRLNKLRLCKGVIAGEGDANIHGVRFSDTGSGYVYERTGSLSGYSADAPVPDAMLPINSGMKRCILGLDGEVVYYLDPDNSMFKEGSYSPTIVNVLDVYAPHNEDNATVSIDGIADPAHIGCMIRLQDGSGVRQHYALIIGAGGDTYILSNPLLIDWGLDDKGKPCTIGVIGDAKLDGSDGQFMVEVPAFYYRKRIKADKSGIWEYREVSLKPMSGATYSPPFYYSAVEGVNTDAFGIPVDGWSGKWSDKNEVWENMSYSPLGSFMMSVVGFYPLTNVYRSEVRTKCAALGDSYHQQGFFNNLAIQYLMLVEAGSFQTQARYGKGVTDWPGGGTGWSAYNGYRPVRRSGDTVRSGNHSWDMSTLGSLARMKAQGGNIYTVQSVSFRGIENPWGHLFMFVDGYNLMYAEPDGNLGVAYSYVTDDPNLFSDAILTGYVMLPDRMETSEHDGTEWVSGNRYWRKPSRHMLPTIKTPSSTAYVGDNLYVDTVPPNPETLRLLAVGGYSYSGALAGAFYVSVNNGSGSRNAHYGGRLCAKKNKWC